MHSNAVQALAGGTISAPGQHSQPSQQGEDFESIAIEALELSKLVLCLLIHDDKGQILMSKKLPVPPNSFILISKIKLV